MRRLFAILLVAGLLLASSFALAAPGRGQSGKRSEHAPVGLGAFEIQAGSRVATGDYVSFSYDENGIVDFRAANRTLFDIRVVGSLEDEDEEDDEDGRAEGARAEGAQMRVRMPNFTFIAHDTPTAASKLETDGRILLSFEPGVTLTQENGSRVRFSFGDASGALRGEDVRVSGRNVSASDELLVILDAPRGAFDQNSREMGHAIAKGHVGAEATLNLADDDTVEHDVVSYGNVTMTTLKAERGNITVLIDGHGFEGRVIVLNVDGRVLGAESADKLNIQIDNASVMPASNLTDILDPDDDGFHPEYYLVYDPQEHVFQLIVTLPHYSVHTLSVMTAIVLPPPSVMIGLVAGLALLVPTALVLFRRR